MAKILFCVHCRTVLEEIRLGDRSALAVCISCDAIGDAREVALGARLVPAESRRGRGGSERRTVTRGGR